MTCLGGHQQLGIKPRGDLLQNGDLVQNNASVRSGKTTIDEIVKGICRVLNCTLLVHC